MSKLCIQYGDDDWKNNVFTLLFWHRRWNIDSQTFMWQFHFLSVPKRPRLNICLLAELTRELFNHLSLGAFAISSKVLAPLIFSQVVRAHSFSARFLIWTLAIVTRREEFPFKSFDWWFRFKWAELVFARTHHTASATISINNNSYIRFCEFPWRTISAWSSPESGFWASMI